MLYMCVLVHEAASVGFYTGSFVGLVRCVCEAFFGPSLGPFWPFVGSFLVLRWVPVGHSFGPSRARVRSLDRSLVGHR